MRFEVRGHQEFLVRTKQGFKADSLIRVLQLLRDHSVDPEIRHGASLMITVISRSINEMQSVEINRLQISATWLLELAHNAKLRKNFWFITAFINEILPVQERRSFTQ